MAMETTAILRQILYQAMKANNLKEVISAIKIMCSKDDIAAVIAQLEEDKQNDN